MWYIVSNWNELTDCRMIFSKNPGSDGRGWRRVLILVAICALAVCVATRFSISISAPGHVVKSMDLRSGGTKQQSLDQDDTGFAEPVASAVESTPIALYSSVLPPAPVVSNDELSLVLYNRPPPFSSVFFY